MWLDLEAERGEREARRATNRSPSTGKDNIFNRRQSCGWTLRPRGGSTRLGSPAPWRATNRSPSTGKDDILYRQSVLWLDLEAERGWSLRPGSPAPWRATNRSPSIGKDNLLYRCQSCSWTLRPREGEFEAMARHEQDSIKKKLRLIVAMVRNEEDPSSGTGRHCKALFVFSSTLDPQVY
jgi:hypothetical protein